MPFTATTNHNITDALPLGSSLLPAQSGDLPRQRGMRCAAAVTSAGASTRRVPVGLRQRLHNIRSQGLGGTGGPQQAKNWSEEELHASWAEWVKHGLPDEQRLRAVQKMRAVLASNDNSLHLTDFGLRSLPSRLPVHKILFIGGNRLNALPDELPAGLTRLVADRNQISQLPSELPAGLELLLLSENHISSLPPRLPVGLRMLDVNSNRLTALPAELPPRLHFLEASDNHLTSLPDAVLGMLHEGTVTVDHNRFAPHVLNEIQRLTQRPEYQGPRIHLFYNPWKVAPYTPPLRDSVGTWLEPAQTMDATAPDWDRIAQEPNAGDFSRFLHALAKVDAIKKDPTASMQIAHWLDRLAASPSLRQQMFSVAHEATTACDDRLSLTFNDMQKAIIVHDVERGRYDAQLPQLVTLGREMFRLEQLEQIARKKVQRADLADEIAAFLAYQVKLRTPLQLTSLARDMSFFETAKISEDDLQQARNQVQQSENRDFPQWLGQWQPWQCVAQRLVPAAHAAATEQRYAQLQDLDFQIAAKMRALELPADDLDAKAALGKLMQERRSTSVDDELTMALLTKQGLTGLLRPVWHDQAGNSKAPY